MNPSPVLDLFVQNIVDETLRELRTRDRVPFEKEPSAPSGAQDAESATFMVHVGGASASATLLSLILNSIRAKLITKGVRRMRQGGGPYQQYRVGNHIQLLATWKRTAAS